MTNQQHITITGDAIPDAVRDLAEAEVRRDGRVGYVWAADLGVDGYEVMAWSSEAESEDDDGRRALLRLRYSRSTRYDEHGNPHDPGDAD